MPAPTKSKDEVIDILLETFRTRGYDGGSLAELSQRTGLGKSSLYHYFPGGKEEMARAVLARLSAMMEAAVVAQAHARGSPAKRLDAILDAINALYDGGGKACLLERMCASVDRGLFQKQLAGAFTTWMKAMSRVFADGGMSAKLATAKAEEAVTRIQGALVLAAGLDDVGPFRRTIADLRGTLKS